MQYTYSVIIPHRDSLELLKRALASIPDREDVQIIVVDNSVRDNDFDSIKQKGNRNFEIYYSDLNKGAGHARNVGLRAGKGKWVLFLDADDFFCPGAFAQFDKYINSEFDIIYFKSVSIYSDTHEKAERHRYYSELVSNFIENKTNSADQLRYCYFPPWGKLIRNKLIQEQKIMFDVVPASNDLMFSVKTGHFAQKIWADAFTAYCITVNQGSLTRTISITNSRSRFCVAISQYKFMDSIGKPDLRFKLMAEVVKSFRFGFQEFIWYISTSYKEKVNIFLGLERWPSVLYRYLIRNNKDNIYTVKVKKVQNISPSDH